MPLGLDQKIATIVWSPLGWGRLTGKIRRGQPLPEVSRLHSTAEQGPPVANEYLYKVVDTLDEVSRETGKTIPQIALNWLLQRPTVANVIIGARNEEQFRQNLAGRMEPDPRTSSKTGRGQRSNPSLPVLAPTPIRKKSEASVITCGAEKQCHPNKTVIPTKTVIPSEVEGPCVSPPHPKTQKAPSDDSRPKRLHKAIEEAPALRTSAGPSWSCRAKP